MSETIRERRSESIEPTTTDESTVQETAERASTCPECGGQLREHPKQAERACQDCGLVVEADQVDHGPEWRAFNPQEKDDKSRVGAPTTRLMHDKGLSSVIDWKDQDAYGNALGARQRRKMQRLRTWDERFRTRDSKERNLKQALGEIERMGSALGLPDDVRETASMIYRRALEADLLPGRSIEAIATAAIYAAARKMNRPRSMDEVAAVSRVDRLEFKRAYRYINRELGLAIEPADPIQYVDRIHGDLDLGDETRYRARELLRDAKGTGAFNGKSPVGLAAAAIYAAGQLTGDTPTQGEISDASDISTVTIRNRYTELLEAAEE